MNNGTIANVYSLAKVTGNGVGSIAGENNGTVQNCYGSQPMTLIGKGNQAVDSYYPDGTNYTKDDFSNGSIAGLLNSKITSDHAQWYSWKVQNKVTILGASTTVRIELTGEVSIEEGAVHVYKKDGTEITETTSGMFKLEDGVYRLDGGIYTYEASAKGYAPKTGTFSVGKQDKTVAVELIAYRTITFDLTPADAQIKVYDIEGNGNCRQMKMEPTAWLTERTAMRWSGKDIGQRTELSQWIKLTKHSPLTWMRPTSLDLTQIFPLSKI